MGFESMEGQIKRLGRVGGFAPGSYMCTCVECGVEFEGDKRAINCLPCAVAKLQAAREEGRRAPAVAGEVESGLVASLRSLMDLWRKQAAIDEDKRSKFPRGSQEWRECELHAALLYRVASDLKLTISAALASSPAQVEEGRRPAPVEGARPFTYAYVYPDHLGGEVMRFGTDGREINGGKPLRAVALYDHPAAPPSPAKDVGEEENEYPPCPTCGAPAGKDCRTIQGRVQPHDSRLPPSPEGARADVMRGERDFLRSVARAALTGEGE